MEPTTTTHTEAHPMSCTYTIEAKAASGAGDLAGAYTQPAWGRERCLVCSAQVALELGYDEPFCLDCAPCDECGHPAGLHHHPASGLVTYDEATCWAESTCEGCAPDPSPGPDCYCRRCTPTDPQLNGCEH